MLSMAMDSAADGNALPDATVMRDILALAMYQGDSLQARILLTANPMARKFLSLLPRPAWLDECWPGQTWKATLPDVSGTGGKPFFSVLTPSYNQGYFLKDTIAGVLRQNFASYEHIVMDGGSTDETLEVLQANHHLKWISEPDRGQTHALNKALAQAQGEVIAWINSDDFYLPGAFAAVHDYFVRHPEESVVTGDCLWGWEATGRLRYIPGEERDFEALIRQWNSHVPGPQPSIFFRRRVLADTGLGDESLHYGMDYDLWLRMALAGHVRRHIEMPVAFYRFHGLSKSGAQQDWSSFYPDWQACFTRYRQHSRLLPRERMLAVAYPLRAGADARERASLCAALKSCAQWKMRDIELVLLSDIPGMQAEDIPAGVTSGALRAVLPQAPVLSLPLRVVPLAKMSSANFIRAAVTATQAFALCMPPITSAVTYEQWYVTPINALLDTPELAQTPLFLCHKRLLEHPVLPSSGPIGCLAMHRHTHMLTLTGL